MGIRCKKDPIAIIAILSLFALVTISARGASGIPHVFATTPAMVIIDESGCATIGGTWTANPPPQSSICTATSYTVVAGDTLVVPAETDLDFTGTLTNLGTITNAGGILTGGAFSNSGTFDNIGAFFSDNSLASSGPIVNDGELLNYGAPLDISTTGSLANYGIINNKAIAENERSGAAQIIINGELTNEAGATLENGGDLDIGVGGMFDNLGAVTNDGDLSNSGTMDNLGTGTIYNTNSLENSKIIDDYGGITNGLSAVLSNNAGATIIVESGGVLYTPGIYNSNTEGFEGGLIVNNGAIIIDCGVTFPEPNSLGSTLSGNPVTQESCVTSPSKMVVNVDPAYVLVVAPDGTQEVGCDSSGNIVNTIPGATIPSCAGGDETITIPNPVAGVYNLVISPYGKGISYTITASTFGSGGNEIDSQTYSSSPSQGNLYLFVSSGGSVVVAGTTITGIPEFPMGVLLAVAAPLVGLIAYGSIKNSRRGMQRSLQDLQGS